MRKASEISANLLLLLVGLLRRGQCVIAPYWPIGVQINWRISRDIGTRLRKWGKENQPNFFLQAEIHTLSVKEGSYHFKR